MTYKTFAAVVTSFNSMLGPVYLCERKLNMLESNNLSCLGPQFKLHYREIISNVIPGSIVAHNHQFTSQNAPKTVQKTINLSNNKGVHETNCF